jgi:hypothetical protein
MGAAVSGAVGPAATGQSMPYRLALILALLLFVYAGAKGQTSDSLRLSPGRLAIIGGVTLATGTAVHLYQQHAWWQGARAPFRFQNDWDYAMNIDKLGHAYGAFFLSHLFSYALRWGGMRDTASIFYGSLLGLSYQLYVEVEDGFHREYGFSPGDAIADVCGALLPIAQTTFPVLGNFNLKWSYLPSREYRQDLQQGVSRVFIDDYQGQIYWLAVDPHFLLSDGLSRLTPRWLGVAAGVSARDLSTPAERRRVYYLSLDYNLSKIVTGSDLLHAIFVLIDHIHLPAPALYYDGGHWKGGIVF